MKCSTVGSKATLYTSVGLNEVLHVSFTFTWLLVYKYVINNVDKAKALNTNVSCVLARNYTIHQKELNWFLHFERFVVV